MWNVIFEPEVEEKLLALPSELMTDMPHCIYPEGLYSALKTMSAIGHPLYVTENGVADADDTRRRWVGGLEEQVWWWCGGGARGMCCCLPHSCSH